MHFFLYEHKHWRVNPKDPTRGIIKADFAKWLRQNVSSYSLGTDIGYDRHKVPRLDIVIPIPEQAMLFKLTWM